MKNQTKSMNNLNIESKYYNNEYNFKNVFSIPLILDQIFQFMVKDDKKRLSMCSKKLYQLYCKQVKKLEIKNYVEESNLEKIKFDKYIDLIELDLEGCKNIKDFSFISKFEKLENLNTSFTYISDISFLEKNKNIKELNLYGCKNIKDFSFISQLAKLENLNINGTKISDISFLEKNKNIKVLYLEGCKNIKDFSLISKLEKLENLNISWTKISDISFLKKNKNIKKLDLSCCKNIKDYSFISQLEKLENLNLSFINI